MAGTTRQPEGADTAGSLAPEEVADDADNATRAAGPDLSGKRVRAIPGGGGTEVHISARDFKANGIDHGPVKFDYFVDRFTVKVGDKPGQLSKKAADFLTKFDPSSFEYMESGK